MAIIRISTQAINDHVSRLYDKHIERNANNEIVPVFPIIHIDGKANGIINWIANGKKISKVNLDDAALKELLSDCDYYAGLIGDGVLDSDAVGIARCLANAARSIRKQLAKAGELR